MTIIVTKEGKDPTKLGKSIEDEQFVHSHIICAFGDFRKINKKIPRRAISEVIASLLLLAITVVGGIIVWTAVSGTGPSVHIESPEAFNVKIIGFDTRDGIGLSGITGLDNSFDKTLTGGSEYIVLTIRNPNVNSVYLDNVMVDLITYTWDENTAGAALSSGPAAGKFSIIPKSGDDLTIVQQADFTINEGFDVRLVIKLNSDIKLYELTDPEPLIADKKLFQRPIPIEINTGIFDTKTFVIPGGSAG